MQDKWVKAPVFIPLAFEAEEAFKKEYSFVNKRLIPVLEQIEKSIMRDMEAGSDLRQAIAKAKKLHKLLKTLRNMRFIEGPKYTVASYSLNWDYRNVIFKLLEKQGYTDIREKLVSAFPTKEKEIDELWNTYHFKSSSLVPVVQHIEDAFAKYQ